MLWNLIRFSCCPYSRERDWWTQLLWGVLCRFNQANAIERAQQPLILIRMFPYEVIFPSSRKQEISGNILYTEVAKGVPSMKLKRCSAILGRMLSTRRIAQKLVADSTPAVLLIVFSPPPSGSITCCCIHTPISYQEITLWCSGQSTQIVNFPWLTSLIN